MDRADLPTVTFRSVDPRDEPVLQEMLYLAIFVPPGETPPPVSILTRPELQRYVGGWGRPGDDGVVAVAPGGQPVGAAWMRLWSDDDHGYGYLDMHTPELSVALREEFRGSGIGTRLLHELLRRADRIYDSVSLSVTVGNPAIRLYRRLGFETVAFERSSMIMRRRPRRVSVTD